MKKASADVRKCVKHMTSLKHSSHQITWLKGLVIQPA